MVSRNFISTSEYGLHSPDNRHMQSKAIATPPPPRSFPLLLAVGSSGLYHDHPLYGSLLVSAVMRL